MAISAVVVRPLGKGVTLSERSDPVESPEG